MSLARWHIPTSDEEIVDIFLEEVGELLHSIDVNMETWMNNPGDQKTLTEIRRSFHTLKGSGRMVKALDLSDMAWKVENMLNQAIAGTVPVSESMMELVAAVRAQIPKMMDAFKHQRSIGGNDDILSLMKLADTLAAGRATAQVPAPLAVATTGGQPPYKRRDFDLKLERVMQRADEALHRSEIALQQARRISAPSQARPRGIRPRDYHAEADWLGKRVDLLSEEVSDVRLKSAKSRRDSVLQAGEIGRLVDKQVGARLEPLESLLLEIKGDIDANRRAVTALRRLGSLALVLSALVGGAIAIRLIVSILSLG